MQNFKKHLEAFGLNPEDCVVAPFGSGHINKTFKVTASYSQHFVLQQINTAVFKNPNLILENWLKARQHLSHFAPSYKFLEYKALLNGKWLFEDSDGTIWRMLNFVDQSITKETVEKAAQARLTAKAFARFSTLLQGADVHSFNVILPRFHDLSFRQQQFDQALGSASAERLLQANETILQLNANRWLTTYFEKISPILPIRIVHMDAKISNVLFNNTLDDVSCIIDLDTMMPGTILSDVGDMIRSMVCEAAEDENDLSKIQVRTDILQAIIESYSGEIADIQAVEKENLAFGGIMLVYMQALRFVTDFLENDHYYSIKYPSHNLVRGQNQCNLLQKLLQEPVMAGYRLKINL